MKSYLNKIASGAAAVGIFLLVCIMASLGFSLMVFLAMFALAVIGLGLLAAPLMRLVQSTDRNNPETVDA